MLVPESYRQSGKAFHGRRPLAGPGRLRALAAVRVERQADHQAVRSLFGREPGQGPGVLVYRSGPAQRCQRRRRVAGGIPQRDADPPVPQIYAQDASTSAAVVVEATHVAAGLAGVVGVAGGGVGGAVGGVDGDGSGVGVGVGVAPGPVGLGDTAGDGWPTLRVTLGVGFAARGVGDAGAAVGEITRRSIRKSKLVTVDDQNGDRETWTLPYLDR
jgi:hypothetical protein